MSATPPLLALAEGRHVRPRKAAEKASKEIVLHVAVVALLRRCAAPDWTWTHIPAGERRPPRDAAKLRAMGLGVGWPDLVLVSPIGLVHSLELKREGGVLGEAQETWRLRAIRLGWPYAVARSMPEVLTILAGWGCLTAEAERAAAAGRCLS